MKIIEAMKKVKANKEKIADLQKKIGENSAHLSIETPVYPDADLKIAAWAQSCEDLVQENIALLTAIARTNLATTVAIEIGGKSVSKTIAEWVWRRREYAKVDLETWGKMTDRGLREGQGQSSTGVPIMIQIVRKYDPDRRDRRMDMYRAEPHAIDAALEVVNATTDLV